jgi:hypothetical protein
MHAEFCLDSLKGRGHSEDLGIDGKIILKGILKRTNSPTFLTLFKNKVSVALFNYGKLHSTLLPMVTLVTMVTMVKQCVQLWDSLLHKHGVNWLPWWCNG